MESGDVLNYAMVISLISSKAWKPVLFGIAAWSGYKVFKRAKSKKEQVSEKISYSTANAKAVLNSAASSVGPPIASVASVAKSAANMGLNGGVNAASAIAPVVQQAAMAAVASASKAARATTQLSTPPENATTTDR